MPEPRAGEAALLRVFVDPAQSGEGGRGGNPVPLVLDATGMSADAMRELAARQGHESSFVLPPEDPAAHDWRLRFFVPGHEMEMCGHATVGTLWALRQWGRWTTPQARVQTLSGSVDVSWDAARGWAWVSQPAATVQALNDDQRDAIARVLNIDPALPGLHVVNASTSRVKTLVRVPDAATLDAIVPDLGAVEALCDAIGSTGLYPYALEATGATARQFPKKSGYPEDAATGIAAAALWGYLHAHADRPVTSASDALFTVRQGVAMGAPSAIQVRTRGDAPGCWLSGDVEWMR
ncbi:PhzF family phenazine biosynthesis protein [Pigmentiphaga litoralis]|nr:PhzF family phenazine biosynthesis isomerase [Pigmentiphaga litoralis]